MRKGDNFGRNGPNGDERKKKRRCGSARNFRLCRKWKNPTQKSESRRGKKRKGEEEESPISTAEPKKSEKIQGRNM